MFLASFLWTPPLIWFALASLALVWLQPLARRSVLIGISSTVLLLSALAWPVEPGWERIYSPYQLLERGPAERGLALIRAAGLYYQHVHDLSRQAQDAFPERHAVAAYYEMPYRLHPAAKRVAIVGAGTGNDVAAALRMGVPHVDAMRSTRPSCDCGRSAHPGAPVCRPPCYDVRERCQNLPALESRHLRPDRLRGARFAHAPEPRFRGPS